MPRTADSMTDPTGRWMPSTTSDQIAFALGTIVGAALYMLF
jgi:hypothetical protein